MCSVWICGGAAAFCGLARGSNNSVGCRVSLRTGAAAASLRFTPQSEPTSKPNFFFQRLTHFPEGWEGGGGHRISSGVSLREEGKEESGESENDMEAGRDSSGSSVKEEDVDGGPDDFDMPSTRGGSSGRTADSGDSRCDTAMGDAPRESDDVRSVNGEPRSLSPAGAASFVEMSLRPDTEVSTRSAVTSCTERPVALPDDDGPAADCRSRAESTKACFTMSRTGLRGGVGLVCVVQSLACVVDPELGRL